MKQLESLVNLSRIGEDVFFDTCCTGISNEFKFDINKYEKLDVLELEKLYENLSLFLKFIKSKRVYTVKEVADEFYFAAFKLASLKMRLDCNELSESKIKDNKDERLRKNLFYKVLDKFDEIHLGIKSSVYGIENKEAYSKIMDLVDEIAKDEKHPIRGLGDKALIAVAFYRALLEDKSTSIATRDKKDLVPLFIIAYDKFQYDENLLSKLQSKKIKIYIPDPERRGEYGVRIENSRIRFREHRMHTYETFIQLIQAIKESLAA